MNKQEQEMFSNWLFANAYDLRLLLINNGGLDTTAARQVFDIWRSKQETEKLLGDKWELFCEHCNMVRPPQKNTLFYHPCPVCGKSMVPSSMNVREIKILRRQLTSLSAKVEELELSYFDMRLLTDERARAYDAGFYDCFAQKRLPGESNKNFFDRKHKEFLESRKK